MGLNRSRRETFRLLTWVGNVSERDAAEVEATVYLRSGETLRDKEERLPPARSLAPGGHALRIYGPPLHTETTVYELVARVAVNYLDAREICRYEQTILFHQDRSRGGQRLGHSLLWADVDERQIAGPQ